MVNPDAQANATALGKYDVYGAIRNTSDVAPGESSHKFCGSLGHTSDDSTGLIYMRARYMDPVTGRFISEDPAGNGANWYMYANDNPVNLVDASGRAADFWTDYLIELAKDYFKDQLEGYLIGVIEQNAYAARTIKTLAAGVADVSAWAKVLSAAAQFGEVEGPQGALSAVAGTIAVALGAATATAEAAYQVVLLTMLCVDPTKCDNSPDSLF